MADPIPYPNTNDDTGVRPGRRATTSTPPSTPRWVKVSGIIALVPILLFVIMMLANMLTGMGGMGNGPNRNISSTSIVAGIIALVLFLLFVIKVLTGGGNGPRRHIPPSSVTEHREQQP